MSAATQFTCPQCQRVLRTASAVDAGQKIRCPACQAVFDPPVADAIPTGPDYPAVSTPIPSSAWKEESSPREDGRRRPPPGSPSDRGPGPRSQPRPPQARGNKKLALTLILGGTGLLLAVVVVVIILVRAGASRTSDKMESLLAHLPARPGMVMALDLSNLKNRNDLEHELPKLGNHIPPVPPGLQNIVRDADSLVVAYREPFRPQLLALRTKKPFSRNALLNAAGTQQPIHDVGGKLLYRLPPGDPNSFTFLALPDPNNQILLLGNLAEHEMRTVLIADKKRWSGEARNLVQQAGAAPLWAIIPLEGQFRDHYRNSLQNHKFFNFREENAVRDARVLALWLESDQRVTAHVGVLGPNANDAANALRFDGRSAVIRAALHLTWDREQNNNAFTEDANKNPNAFSSGGLATAAFPLSPHTCQQLARQANQVLLAHLPRGDGRIDDRWPDKKDGPKDVIFKDKDWKDGKGFEPPFDGVLVLNITDRLTNFDPIDPLRQGSRHKVHICRMVAGRTYQIDLVSFWDNYLRLEDSTKRNLLENDDGGGGRNARIIFQPNVTDDYRIIATSFGGQVTGEYSLFVRER